MPTREQTTQELKRRLAKELYKAELDLANGLMIAGRPCDCLSEKHTLQLDACAEELISQDPDNRVYQEIRQWIVDNQHKVTPQAIMSGEYREEYPRMALDFKEFRKRVIGTAQVSIEPSANQRMPVRISMRESKRAIETELEPHEITLEEAQEIAAAQAREKVRKLWTAQK
jgi:hypothetical protein